MTEENLLSRISIDPNICFGKPCIKGHRIWVSLILSYLAGGATVEEVLEAYPGIEREDVFACLAYAAEVTQVGYVEIPLSEPEKGSQVVKLKLDENVDIRVISRLRLAGHDVATVQGQSLSSISDTELIEVCRREERCLVTADRGFGNRLRFNPAINAGIVVICLSSRSTSSEWQEAIETLIQGLETATVVGKLWIIRRKNF